MGGLMLGGDDQVLPPSKPRLKGFPLNSPGMGDIIPKGPA